MIKLYIKSINFKIRNVLLFNIYILQQKLILYEKTNP
jgi:hypothetical protein